MKNKLNNKGFSLIELMVVITIIAILSVGGYTIYQGYLNRAADSTRLTDMSALKGSIDTYKTSNIAPPINQYALVSAGMLSKLPTDPKNKRLYQYNADIRGWNNNYQSQGTSGNSYLLATNTPLSDKESASFDGEEYNAGKSNNSYKTDIKNLKYYGGYIVMGGGNANFLTDNGKTDLTAKNKYTGGSAGGPSSAPGICGSISGGGGNKQLDPYEGDIDAFIKKTSKNLGVSMSEIYGNNISGSMCLISIKGDGQGTSVANPAVNINSVTETEGTAEEYSNYYN